MYLKKIAFTKNINHESMINFLLFKIFNKFKSTISCIEFYERKVDMTVIYDS